MSDYIGVIDESQGAWGVRSPDLPGCCGVGLARRAGQERGTGHAQNREEAYSTAVDGGRGTIAGS
jgi:hypothetical protein